jgi:hypothetical protein
LAAQAAIKHFRNFCEGRVFQLWTDHKPLVTALSCVLIPISPRKQRHLAFISEFKCTATTAADPVDYEEMAAEQHRCPETQQLLGGTSLKLAFRQTGTQRLAGDVSTGTFRPIVPLKFR